MKKVAVVILNWNGKSFLKRYLPLLLQKTDNQLADVIVADNNSSDDSVEFLRENFPETAVIMNDKNYGFAGGYNHALIGLNYEYYLLLNSDIEVTDHYLEPLIELLDNDQRSAACMPKIRQTTNRNCFEYAGAAGGFIDKFGYPYCRGRVMDKYEEDHGQYDDKREIFWASGACFLVRRNVFDELGGFDADFFAHMEEIDLCWRIHHSARKIMYCPDSLVYHVGGGTLPNTSPFKLYLNYRNSLYMLFKNLPANQIITIFVPRLFLDGISAVVYLLKMQPKNFLAVFRAHFFFYQHLPKLRKKRKEINQRHLSKDLIPGISIIWKYVIEKKRKFSDL